MLRLCFELGLLMGLVRADGELRCGTLEGELGHLELALSSAAAINMFAFPRHEAMLRGGIDMSLAGSSVVPLLDVYFGYVPWRRGVGYDVRDPDEGLIYKVADHDRGEYRLSIPVGVAIREVDGTLDTRAPSRSRSCPSSLWAAAIWNQTVRASSSRSRSLQSSASTTPSVGTAHDDAVDTRTGPVNRPRRPQTRNVR